MVVRVRKYRLSLSGTFGLMAGLVLAGASCGDPVRDKLVTSLGPEAPNVPPGPMHRPGQPCLACHDADLGSAPPFSLGGTVYVDAMTSTPVADVSVNIVDSQGRSFSTVSNCAGNFFVK